MDKIGIATKSWYFFRLQELVFDDPNLDTYDKVIYAVLSKYADYDTKICYPSIKTISEKASCSCPTTIKHIKKLVKAGYITKTKRKDKNNKDTSNLYKIKDLGYIYNLKKYAKENENNKLLKIIHKRLKQHPIPTYEEIMNINSQLQKENQKNNMDKLYNNGWR